MRAINSAVMKELNRKMVFNCIRRRPVSRAELSEETQLTRASITQIVDGLMADGLVVEKAVVDRKTPGRRQTQLALVEDALCIAGIYCSRSSYTLSLINLSGKVLWSDNRIYNERDFSEIMDEAAELLRSAVESLSPKQKVCRLGVCLPSPVEKSHAEIIRKPGVWKNRNIYFEEEMQKRLGWDVSIGNISNAFALDELYFGIGCEGAENFMVLRVDEGVGAGFIINNKLFRGARGFSPEIGHITLMRGGPRCICGNQGCLELFLAPPHILRDTPFSSWREVMDAMDTNPAAKEIYDRQVETLAFEIMNLANVMDLDKVVITGDLVYGGEKLTRDIGCFMDENFVHRMDEDSVVPSREVNLARVATMPAYHALFA